MLKDPLDSWAIDSAVSTSVLVYAYREQILII